MEKIVKGISLTKKELLENLSACFHHPDPFASMYGVLKVFLVRGYNREQMKNDLTKYMLLLREQQKEREEDLILEVFSCLVDWCGPHAKL